MAPSRPPAARTATGLALAVRGLGGGQLESVIDGRSTRLHAAADCDTRWVAHGGRIYELQQETRRRRRGQAGPSQAEGSLRAPMPGQVRAVNVSPGDDVARGETLLVLEAMKMEIRIQSPCDGTVAALPVAVGEQVERGQLLAVVG